MKYLIPVLVILGILLCPLLWKDEAPGGEFSPGSVDLSGITRIELTNCHNGFTTRISEPGAIARITGFLDTVVGAHPESGKGYYEGSYSLTLYREGETVLSLGFGDSDCFYTGSFGDGYPARYPLTGMTIKEDVIPFLALFDASGSPLG